MLTKIKQEPFRKKRTFKVLSKALLISVGLPLKDKRAEEKEFLVASTGSEQYCTTYGEYEIRLYAANAQNSKPLKLMRPNLIISFEPTLSRLA